MTDVVEKKNVRVTLAMSKEQVERMDNCANKLGISRNAFMQVAIAEYITTKELLNEEMLADIVRKLIMKDEQQSNQ